MKACISIISIVELYTGIEEKGNKQEINLKQLLSLLEILPIDFSLSKLAGTIKRKYRLSITDSIIAATSFSSKLKLFSFNRKHFQQIPGLLFFETGKPEKV